MEIIVFLSIVIAVVAVLTSIVLVRRAGDMAAHGIKMDLEQMTELIPSTFQVVFILGIMAFVSFLLIDRLYKQRGE